MKESVKLITTLVKQAEQRTIYYLINHNHQQYTQEMKHLSILRTKLQIEINNN